MSQINPVSIFRNHKFKNGDQVRTDLFPDQVLTILKVEGEVALLKTALGNTKWVALRRLRAA